MSFERAEVREAHLLAVARHILRYGQLGKKSKARLKAAVRENAEMRTHSGREA